MSDDENEAQAPIAQSAERPKSPNIGFQNPFINAEAGNVNQEHKSTFDTVMPAVTAGAAAIGAAINPALGMGIAAVGTVISTIVDSREKPPAPPTPPPSPLYTENEGQQSSIQNDTSVNVGAAPEENS